ncbi:protein adenylyltransferase SelO family protein [Asticcacaulis sp. EMRT-3]|uniref:protein adenylyltransferase SelO family protein n=1 Tax=Asticcacaulis sp. EMRT-3 TaxID=3040349 RepID=UPI0024AEEF71|nr:YdiU family protein [Asticcacaulis sp. EMRT-3]MDI7775053.1 YdiU family protein [Asticcacaulis sp. EMRT-3]
MRIMPYRPAPRLSQSALALHDQVSAADFPQTVLRYRNAQAAASVGLGDMSDADWIRHFGRFAPLPDNQPMPLALRYHGHQFRHYNPDLGDGRGFLFAQLLDNHDRLLDLGTKGSGTTPWSRGGDGRLTLKGGVREVLATAMLEALGVNTSKSFSLIETGEALMRGDEPSPTRSSVLVRLSHSHIRFGTFERLAFLNDADTMRDLADFVRENYVSRPVYGEGEPRSGGRGNANEILAEAPDTAALFDAVVTRTAALAAGWMAAGFVHGVLNTDNMNITGESFDYGPYRFLPYADLGFTAAYFDEGGLYAYGRQPDAVLWNLAQLGRSLTLICEQAPLVASLNAFADRYQDALQRALCARFNLRPVDDAPPLAEAFFAFAGTLRFDGSFEGLFYDWFGGVISEPRAMQGPRGPHYQGAAFDAFRAALAAYAPAAPDKLDHPRFAKADPETLLIAEIEAIWAQIAKADDWSAFNAKLAAISDYGQALQAVSVFRA